MTVALIEVHIDALTLAALEILGESHVNFSVIDHVFSFQPKFNRLR